MDEVPSSANLVQRSEHITGTAVHGQRWLQHGPAAENARLALPLEDASLRWIGADTAVGGSSRQVE